MSKLPTVFRSVNESLDEILTAFDKLNSIYQSAKQMSPVLKQAANLIAETNAAAAEQQVRLSEAMKTARNRPVGGKLRQKETGPQAEADALNRIGCRARMSRAFFARSSLSGLYRFHSRFSLAGIVRSGILGLRNYGIRSDTTGRVTLHGFYRLSFFL
ncbi:hypothetical protein [Paenibacillus elgii]|uniref:hypothetical protein n=1 Tax=Paenibacillus elgii TaxID=189691 RepID=UPI000248E102|nr:hypothetical protein [Paenibacillus elgii]